MSILVGIIYNKLDQRITQVIIPDRDAGLLQVVVTGDQQMMSIARTIYEAHQTIADLALTLGLQV